MYMYDQIDKEFISSLESGISIRILAEFYLLKFLSCVHIVRIHLEKTRLDCIDLMQKWLTC